MKAEDQHMMLSKDYKDGDCTPAKFASRVGYKSLKSYCENGVYTQFEYSDKDCKTLIKVEIHQPDDCCNFGKYNWITRCEEM